MTGNRTTMKKILIIAGEASGDLHGSTLVREIRKKAQDLDICGVGSSRMREAGVRMLADASEISVVGGTEVLTHIGAIYRVYALLKRFLRDEKPELLILIDFPDFNILVGKAARRLGIPVLYYISPQVWAWRRGRVRTIARLVKTMMVVFPFEVELYRVAGVDVRFVGHPLTDIAHSSMTKQDARQRYGLDPSRRTVALLPGSRKSEIEHLLPDMLRAASILRSRFPEIQFVLPLAPTVTSDFIDSFLKKSPAPVTIADGNVYDILRASDAAIVTSGTATLETGLMAVPMVIVYRMSRLSFFIARLIIKVSHIGLVNIVAGKGIVPELIQNDATPENMAREITTILADPERHAQMTKELTTVRARLGEAGASERAASVVMEVLGSTG